ncbi:ankyrin repeat domain-containing protein [Dactylosporangium sp. NPDC051541]|uniref:ankyrin repeat domain-containing protein n=1 Tax=Dactylosporangium sp. NPDC051541 TaxID=3363977 RepID=UPI0037A69649
MRLPDRPDLDQLRRQARALQRAARAGEPEALARIRRDHPGPVPDEADLRLNEAQLVVAREYGFASWPRLVRYVNTIAEHEWDTGLATVAAQDPAAEFCRLACLSYGRDDGPDRWARARDLLARHPDLTKAGLWAAAAAARPDDVRDLLATQPQDPGGPLRWRPLFYLVYSRYDPDIPEDRVLDSARLLLDAGADPDDGYLFDALPSPFTLLTGVFGLGELGRHRQPPHPHWRALGRLLLDRGADPNDAQTLYNRMFEPDDSHLELLFEYGLGTGDGGPWRRRIETLPDPAQALRTLLRWAVEHQQTARVRLLVEHGVDFRSPFTADGPAWSPRDGRTPIEIAQLNGDTEIAGVLLAAGAEPPAPDPVDDFIAAAFRADADAVRATPAETVAEARRRRPGLIVWAAARAPITTVALLAEVGFDVNAYGRTDAPVEAPWETALHHAAANGHTELTRLLLSLGADRTLRDHRFDATPLDWAHHFGQTETAALLDS